MIRSRPLFPLVILAVFACESATEPPVSEPLLPPASGGAFQLAALGVGGGGVHFLPPLGAPAPPEGTFDPRLAPVLEVCQDTACDALHARFTTESQGASAVRLDREDEHYIANWSTRESGAQAGMVYTIRVRVGTRVLAHTAVEVVQTGADAQAVRKGGGMPLVVGQTLPIKVRIETGIVGSVEVTPREASTGVGETAAFQVAVLDLHGQPVPDASPSWSAADPLVASVDGAGVATGQAPGQTWIHAAWGAASDSALVTVLTPEGPGDDEADTEGYAYVTDSFEHTVTVLNRKAEVLEVIEVDPTPFMLAMHPEGTRAYLTHAGSGRTVSVLDLESNTVVNSIRVGSRPLGIAYDPVRDLIHVGNEVSGFISVIDASSESVLASVPGQRTSFLGVHPDGRRLLTSGCGGDRVSVFDIETRTITGFIPVDGAAWCVSGLAPLPNGTHAYALSSGQSALLLLDLEAMTTRVVGTGSPFNFPTGVILISPDGTRAYVANENGGGAGAVLVVNTETHEIEETLATWGRPSRLALSEDGTHLWVVTRANVVQVIRLSDGNEVHRIQFGMQLGGIAIRP